MQMPIHFEAYFRRFFFFLCHLCVHVFQRDFWCLSKLKCMQRMPRVLLSLSLLFDIRIRLDWSVFFHNSIMTHDCIWHLTMFTWNDFFQMFRSLFSTLFLCISQYTASKAYKRLLWNIEIQSKCRTFHMILSNFVLCVENVIDTCSWYPIGF